jgi:hypothetical protein
MHRLHDSLIDCSCLLMSNSSFHRSILRLVSPGSPSDDLRMYAHCTKSGPSGSLSLLFLNFGSHDDHVHFVDLKTLLPSDKERGPTSSSSRASKRHVYELTSATGSIHSQRVRLNGKVLRLSQGDRSLPQMNPVILNTDTPLKLQPQTMTFVVLPHAEVPACTADGAIAEEQ